METPQLILGADGRAPVAAAIHAGDGRVTSLHYGTYDYSASLQIAAEYQAADHPAADHAKQVMQLAAAGTGVHLSDGSTNILPVGDSGQVRSAWRLHAGLVGRALQRGFYQGWDMHPGQLPTRYLANFAFYRQGFPRAARRLADYVGNTGSGILDEPATARALARYLYRGYACGAVEESELVASAHLDADQLATLARPHSDTEDPDVTSQTPKECTMTSTYYAPHGGHPEQTELLTDRAMFRESYAVLPRGTMRDIVTSLLPFWDHTRLWVIARPLSGFAETFSQYIVEVSPGGGSDKPELDPQAEGVVFVVEGSGAAHHRRKTSTPWTRAATPISRRVPTGRCTTTGSNRPASTGCARPTRRSKDWTHRPPSSPPTPRSKRSRCPAPKDVGPPPASPIPRTCGTTCTSTSSPSNRAPCIPFAETHVMEHGLYVLQGKAVYRLNEDWVEVQEGDFMWLRAFCPQACYAGGPGPFRYLLYKDVNRHARLSRQFL